MLYASEAVAAISLNIFKRERKHLRRHYKKSKTFIKNLLVCDVEKYPFIPQKHLEEAKEVTNLNQKFQAAITTLLLHHDDL